MTRVYRTMIGTTEFYAGPSLERAIELWDAYTHNTGGITAGGIGVTDYDGDTVTRDGWIMHVRRNGVVYLHPRAIVGVAS